jgi:hypothetical protein
VLSALVAGSKVRCSTTELAAHTNRDERTTRRAGYLSAFFCFAQRAFCASEIFLRAAADIFRRLRGGVPPPSSATGRAIIDISCSGPRVLGGRPGRPGLRVGNVTSSDESMFFARSITAFSSPVISLRCAIQRSSFAATLPRAAPMLSGNPGAWFFDPRGLPRLFAIAFEYSRRKTAICAGRTRRPMRTVCAEIAVRLPAAREYFSRAADIIRRRRLS